MSSLKLPLGENTRSSAVTSTHFTKITSKEMHKMQIVFDISKSYQGIDSEFD